MQRDYSWKPSWSPIHKECDVHPHVPAERADLFEVADGGSTEYEVLNWLHSTIRVLKPQLVLETGAWEGFGTTALAHACKLNGFGKVHSLEVLPPQCVRLQTVLEEEHLLKWVEVHCVDSLEFLQQSNIIFDIGFFDSLTEIRPIECEIMLNKGTLRNLAVFHDTSPHRSESAPDWTSTETQNTYREKVLALAKHPRCTGYYDSPLSRGFMALFLKG